MDDVFGRVARQTAQVVGSPWTFIACIIGVAIWLALGPLFKFSDTYQLVFNTTLSAITWLLVILLQNTQNTDSAALHVKLDDLLRAVEGARTDLAGLESRPRAELEAARRAVHEGPADTSA